MILYKNKIKTKGTMANINKLLEQSKSCYVMMHDKNGCYARNSEFINKFLSYYGNKNGIETNLAKESDYNEISKFLRYGEGVGEYLQNTAFSDPLALAKLLTKD